MMILPPAVHRFISVAQPFTHHSIMTMRRIILMIIVLWAIPTVLYISLGTKIRAVYVPSLGGCAILSNLEFIPLFILIIYGSPFLLVTISAVYLRHKIIHVKAYIRDLHQYGMDRSKLSKSQRLKELLTEQVKPTIRVFVVGGMDGLFTLLTAVITAFSLYSTPIVHILILQVVSIPLFFLQSLSHALSYGFYNREIRNEMHLCYPKHSQVIVLNGQQPRR